MNLSEEKFKNPLSIVEEEFSKVLNQFLAINHSDEIDENTQNQLDFAENHTAKTLVINNGYESAKARYEERGMGDYIRGFKSWIPGHTWHNLDRINPRYQEDYGQGAELSAIVSNLWSIQDPGELADQYQATFNSLWDVNPDDAMKFAEAMNSYSIDDRNMDQLWSAVDIGFFIFYLAVCWKLFKPQRLNIIGWPIFRSMFENNRGRFVLVGAGLLWLILFLI